MNTMKNKNKLMFSFDQYSICKLRANKIVNMYDIAETSNKILIIIKIVSIILCIHIV